MNGWTPTPTNKERIEHDANQREFWEATPLVYNFEKAFEPDEADADKLHELSVTMDTDPAHILNAQQEPDWNEGTTPSLYILGGEVVEYQPYKVAEDSDEHPF